MGCLLNWLSKIKTVRHHEPLRSAGSVVLFELATLSELTKVVDISQAVMQQQLSDIAKTTV